MNRTKLVTGLLFWVLFQLNAQNSSFIILGDLHYNIYEDHDLKWLSAMPGDLVKESKDYAAKTEKYWVPFMEVIREKAETVKPPVKAIIQVGDLSEGLAGSPEKANQMMAHTVAAIDSTCMPVPWIIAKGNHETYGPGADEAFQHYFVPMFRKQTGNPDIKNASYSYTAGNVQIVCVDPWDKDVDMVEFLEKEFAASEAKYKFVVVHKPVIPVSTLCWYTLREDEPKHQKLLEVIAKNKAFVIAGHVHKYSVVCRKTDFGNIVQVTVISVINNKDYLVPNNTIYEYGPSIAERKPVWSPETLEERTKILRNEAKYVTYFKQNDLPGYAVLKIDDKRAKVTLEYYAAFADKPWDEVDLSELIEGKNK